jgi:hypothetical protein
VFTAEDCTTRTTVSAVEVKGPAVPVIPAPAHDTDHVTVALTG